MRPSDVTPSALPRRASALAALVLATACSGTPGPGTAPGTHHAVSLHGGDFCPTTLPPAPRETYGFGTEAPATASPRLPTPQEAWLCTYQLLDVASKGRHRPRSEWVRSGRQRQLDAVQLRSLSAALPDLHPPPATQACTADLGPRVLVSYTSGADLIGIVVDGYGCRDVRLTDDPFHTVPGDATEHGTVPGVLSAPEQLLRIAGLQ